MGAVYGEVAGADRDRRQAFAAAADCPAARDRLPKVLVVGQAVQPGPELLLPVRLKLVQLVGPDSTSQGQSLRTATREGVPGGGD
jgi:hypothetical protein